MNYLKLSVAFAFCLICTVSFGQTKLFDDNWRFHRGDAMDAWKMAFDDSQWRLLDLPHDWSIEDLPGSDSPFDPDAISGVSGGFTTGGTGWYRKTFEIPSDQQGKRIYIQFDGVYMNSSFWLNGKSIGEYPYGYSSFWFDITDHINYGSDNVIAVQVKNEGRNSRWYSGSGIYRHVWLRSADPLHIAQWGTWVSTIDVSESEAKLTVQTTTLNKNTADRQAAVKVTIVNASGDPVAEASSEQTIPGNGEYKFIQEITVPSPRLWSTETPELYTAEIELYHNERLTDHATTTFGIREISFSAENGFLLNGQPVLLKGGCVHHDNGQLGARAYDRAEERKVALLKASGYNAIRTAHNPPSPAFLDACDRLGMLVIDEAFDTWNEPKNKQDYNLYFDEWWKTDIENLVLRDRNHPSVIMWSTGNEIPNRHKPEVAQVSKMLTDYIRELDPTRPVTSGVNGVGEDKDYLFSTMDIAGYNYAPEKYVPDHERVPDRVVYGSESFAVDAYDYWKAVEDYPWVIGDFVWTAFDYIGEASIGWLGYPQNKDFFPWNLAYCGDIDVCGWKRPQSYYRDALWSDKPVASIFVKPPVPTFDRTHPDQAEWSNWEWEDVVADWSWEGHEGEMLEVHVYTNCEEAELFLNGKSLGKVKPQKLLASWKAPYETGVLRVVGYNAGKNAVESELESVKNAVELRLTADQETLEADNQDLSYITIEAVDENGNRNPRAENLIRFEIAGPGELIAVGNANPESVESYTDPERKLWKGRALAIIKSGYEKGTIRIKATSDGLKPAEISISIK